MTRHGDEGRKSRPTQRRGIELEGMRWLRIALLALILLAHHCQLATAAKASGRRSRGPVKNMLPFANVAEHSLLNQGADQDQETVKIIKASHFSLSFRLGGKINILCMAVAQPRPTITWYKDGAELVLKNNIHVQEERQGEFSQMSRIEIDPATFGNQGIYTCLAHNGNGSIAKNFKTEFFY